MISASSTSRVKVNVQMNKTDIDDIPPPETNLPIFIQTNQIPLKTPLITLRYNPQIIF